MDDHNAVMLAPDSRHFSTWDVLDVTEYGSDVSFIDDALATMFQHHNIAASRITIAGFSDGASEALGLGLLNVDLFTGVIGFSPGTLYAPFARGHTRAFVSHGDVDTVLSYVNSKDGIVPAIAALGVPVKFQSFSGGHQLPLAIATTALDYALGPK
jgi:predicted esterase